MSMQQLIKRFLWAGLLVFGLQSARAFSLAGPVGNGGDFWQQTVIGYGPPVDDIAPKNIGEEYRRNVPVMYYTFNANFLDFFGSNGVVAVDAAFATLNKVFTNSAGQYLTNGVDSYTPDLSTLPLETRHLNFQAQALGLFDLKSWTLALMMKQLGLADPVFYNWTLHDRAHVGSVACPAGMEYLVVQRNFDVVNSPLNQLQYSPYVNGTLYSYYILEVCTGSPVLAETIPFAVDPLADIFSPVASFDLGYGTFYTGLTRDDVAGLRYLLTTNNVNTESPPANTLLQNTNFDTQQLLFTADLGALLSSAKTNPPATLTALFPGLVVGNSSFYFSAVSNATVTAIFTNYYGEPAGTPPHLVLATNYTVGPATNYVTSFANVVITTNYFANSYRTNTQAILQTLTIGPLIGAPAGTTVTNPSTQAITLTNVPSGDYYLIPAGTCGFNILSPQPSGYPIPQVTATTNLIASAFTTNAATGQVFGYSQSLIIYSTNYIFVVNPCTLTASPTALYQGIEGMRFIRADYDSLLSQFFQPITNTITMMSVTNSQLVRLTFQRVVTAPNVLFSAADLATGPSSNPHPVVFTLSETVPVFDQANILPALAGPGIINPPTEFAFDKVGPVYYNYTGLMDGTPYFTETPGIDASDLYYGFYFLWASYDGTTNDPVVYPNGMSIQNLENNILVQITPTSLPNGTNGAAYTPVTFTATGGAFNYSPAPTWSSSSLPSAPPSSGLPPGLTLLPSGSLSGTPTKSDTYDFYVIMTDSLGRSVKWFYSITIQ